MIRKLLLASFVVILLIPVGSTGSLSQEEPNGGEQGEFPPEADLAVSPDDGGTEGVRGSIGSRAARAMMSSTVAAAMTSSTAARAPT